MSSALNSLPTIYLLPRDRFARNRSDSSLTIDRTLADASSALRVGSPHLDCMTARPSVANGKSRPEPFLAALALSCSAYPYKRIFQANPSSLHKLCISANISARVL